MKILKTVILLIVICISILGIVNKKRVEDLGIENDVIKEHYNNTIIKEKITIAEDIDIIMDNEKEAEKLEDENITIEENEKIVAREKNEEIEKVYAKKNTGISNKKGNTNIKVDKTESEDKNKEIPEQNKEMLEQIKEKDESIKSNYEVIMSQKKAISLCEMGESKEQKTMPRMLKDNNVRINFDNK